MLLSWYYQRFGASGAVADCEGCPFCFSGCQRCSRQSQLPRGLPQEIWHILAAFHSMCSSHLQFLQGSGCLAFSFEIVHHGGHRSVSGNVLFELQMHCLAPLCCLNAWDSKDKNIFATQNLVQSCNSAVGGTVLSMCQAFVGLQLMGLIVKSDTTLVAPWLQPGSS